MEQVKITPAPDDTNRECGHKFWEILYLKQWADDLIK